MTIDISIEHEMGCQVEKLYVRVTLSCGEGWGEVIAATVWDAAIKSAWLLLEFSVSVFYTFFVKTIFLFPANQVGEISSLKSGCREVVALSTPKRMNG